MSPNDIRADILEKTLRGRELHFATSYAAIRADLAAAGVPFDIDGKKRADLHSFRRTAIKWMVDAGVPVQTAAQLFQHRSVRTTIQHYLDAATLDQAAAALARMPSVE